MKVLTIRQPWASLIIDGYKEYEFRSWKTNYRGEILIHAGKNIDKEAMIRLEKYLPSEIPLGEIIGKVKLDNCVKTDFDFLKKLVNKNADIYSKSIFKEEYAWHIKLIEKFNNPISAKGKLGLWNYEI